MAYPVMPLGFLGSQGDNDTYQISRSLRFNSADSAYLNRTPASAGNRRTWSLSFWMKRGGISTANNQEILSVYTGSNTDSGIFDFNVNTSNALSFGGYSTVWFVTSQVFRDVSAWYHILVSVDSTQSTSSDRLKLYVNGSQITSFSTLNYPSLNQDFAINTTNSHQIGRYSFVSSYYFDGYLTEINFIDGQALTPSSFGETDAITGRWKAKAYSGTYGTNGFYLKFADNSGTTSTTLGKDSSGNGNNWTPNNFSVTAGAGNDSLVDSPTNYGTDTGLGGEVRGNYCTLNPLMRTSATISDGNLKVSNQTANRVAPAVGTIYADISATQGVYFEVAIDTVGAGSLIGIIRSDVQAYESSPSTTSGVIGLASTAELYSSGSFIASFTTYTTNDILGVYFSSGNLYYSKNGTVMNSGSPVLTGLTGYWTFYATNGGSVGTLGCTANFGQRPFAYTAPAGFKALCTTNLTTPTIKKPSSSMDVVTYTGTGASQSISSLGFSPDLVWIKGRSGATDHALYDVIRGSQARLESNNTDAEVTSDNGLTSFDSAGFTVGTLAQVNTNTATYVGWSWDAGSTNSTNTSGSITSTVRANAQAGFNIVSYTGTGANATVGHGLGVAPKMVIVKRRDAGSSPWMVWHSGLSGGTYYLVLSSTVAQAAGATRFTSSPTSSVVNIGTDGDLNASSGTYIAYCFAEIEGYSKFGSYTGNGSSDGPFVWCGFRPKFILVKNASSATALWEILDSSRDTFNPAGYELYPNSSSAEGNAASSGGDFDFLSNGFKSRRATTELNSSGATHIFAAFAEAPFKYARAR